MRRVTPLDRSLWLPRVVLVCCIGVLSLALAAGCATVPAWERDRLADPLMLFPEDRFERSLHEQHLEYREGSVGGSNAQGGGCGCG